MQYWLKPRKSRFRRWSLKIHLWLGLSLGLLLSVVCITGSIVVYKPEMEKIALGPISKVNPKLTTVSLQYLYNMVATKYPSHTIQSVATYGGKNAAWNFRLVPPPGEGKRLQVYIDQYRGTILGEDNFKGNFLQIMYDLHADLLFGKNGRLVNGIAALLFVLLCLTGLIIWYPGWGKMDSGFKYNRKSNWKGKNYDIHKLSGFWSAGLLIFVALTGAYFPFKKEYETLTAFVTKTPHTLESPKLINPDSTLKLTDLDIVYQLGKRALPEGEITFIRFPQKTVEHFSVRKYIKGDWGRIGDNYVFIHRNKPQIIRTDRFTNLPLGVKVTRAMFPLHFGTFWNNWSRILWIILGLIAPLLFVTGFIIWYKKLTRRHYAA